MDSDSNLWVAGGLSLTMISTAPRGIIDIVPINAIPTAPVLMLAFTGVQFDVDLSAPAVCNSTACCPGGAWDGGIAISATGPTVVYVGSSNCSSGLVRTRIFQKFAVTVPSSPWIPICDYGKILPDVVKCWKIVSRMICQRCVLLIDVYCSSLIRFMRSVCVAEVA